ncbi:peptidoglycan DD-metalloendopeptidase family protein [Lacibacter sp. MH-610]|uniref:murein hydrolase activator EnvC family protein n=1 Tax=Lacibacter sp. MH-610 TaxID=3020883 RepID=UPI00389267B7
MQRLLAFVLFLAIQLSATAQQPNERAELERKKRETQKEIDILTNQYNEIKKNKKASLGQLAVIQRKLQLRNKIIGDINKQVNVINQNINNSYKEMRRLQKDLDTLKMNYAQNVVYAYKNRSSYDFLNFLFSASDFNDAIRRISYMRAYRNYRSQQLDAIVKTEKLYKEKIVELTNNKKEKTQVLGEQTKEMGELVKDKNEQAAVVDEIKKKEKEINKTLAAKKKQAQQLQASITAVINREIANARKEAAAKAKAEEAKIKEEAKNNTTVTTPNTNAATTNKTTVVKKEETKKPASYLEYNKEDIALGASFESNKGRLPFPVDNGYISGNFGTNTVPGTSVKYQQDFITITSPVGTSVKACFDGEVMSVYDVGGMTAVTIKHGKYFTTYSNLASATVSKGQQVKTGQLIGRVGENLDGDGELNFILARELQFINPTGWLRSR